MFSALYTSIHLPLAISISAMSGALGSFWLKISGTCKHGSSIGRNEFSTGKFVVAVQHVMGLRNPQACLLLWIAVPEDSRSRGSSLPLLTVEWLMEQAPTCRHVFRSITKMLRITEPRKAYCGWCFEKTLSLISVN